MPTPEEYIETFNHNRIAAYAFTLPSLALWIGLLARMLVSKDRDKLHGLIVVGVLMILN
jgi:hypothetical protein